MLVLCPLQPFCLSCLPRERMAPQLAITSLNSALIRPHGKEPRVANREDTFAGARRALMIIYSKGGRFPFADRRRGDAFHVYG